MPIEGTFWRRLRHLPTLCSYSFCREHFLGSFVGKKRASKDLRDRRTATHDVGRSKKSKYFVGLFVKTQSECCCCRRAIATFGTKLAKIARSLR
jgi:hypothetical protein